MRIGWVGVGKMGGQLSRRILAEGYELFIYDIQSAQMEPLVELGAHACASSSEAAEKADVIFSMVPNGRILKSAVFGKDGILEGISAGKIFLDISTISVEDSAEIARAIGEKGAFYLPCPVSGSTVQAQAGTLTVMASGNEEAYRKVEPVLALFGQKRYYMGPAEEARVMKLVIQSMVGAQFQSYAEALVLGEKAGVDWNTMIEILSECSAASTNIRNKVAAFQTRDFSPMSTVHVQLKDMNLVMDLARQYNVPVPVTAVATQYYNAMVASGRGDLDYAAILLVNEENCGIHWPEDK